MAHSDSRGRRPDRQVSLLRSLSHHFGYRTRDSRGELHFVKGVAVALQEFGLLPAQSEHLVAVRRLKDANERLDMEAVGYHSQLGDRALQSVNPEHAGAGQQG